MRVFFANCLLLVRVAVAEPVPAARAVGRTPGTGCPSSAALTWDWETGQPT